MPYRRRATTKPRRRAPMKGRGRAGYRRKNYGSRNHGVKSFTCEYKISDVLAPADGLLPDGIQVYNLKTKFSDLPINAQISALFRQVAITGVKVMYRTTNPTPSMGADADLVPHPSVSCYYVEDKDTENSLTLTGFKSQDNMRTLVSHKNFAHYVKNPRPALYQLDGAGNRLKTIDTSNQIHWISTNSSFGVDLFHLHSQFAVSELPPLPGIGDTDQQKQGELWVKVYIKAKEQRA